KEGTFLRDNLPPIGLEGQVVIDLRRLSSDISQSPVRDGYAYSEAENFLVLQIAVGVAEQRIRLGKSHTPHEFHLTACSPGSYYLLLCDHLRQLKFAVQWIVVPELSQRQGIIDVNIPVIPY